MLSVSHPIERTAELIMNFLFRVRLHPQRIKEQEIIMFCVILFRYAHNWCEASSYH